MFIRIPMRTQIPRVCLKYSGQPTSFSMNYRLVSNLSFLSKIIERAVVSQSRKYLLVNSLNETQQSTFKCDDSTETALLRVKNDIMMSINQSTAVVLVLLYMSAAFDTIYHHIRFSQLENKNNCLVCRKTCFTGLRPI